MPSLSLSPQPRSSVADDSTRFAAIEIGGTKLQLAVGTAAGRIFARRRFTVDAAAGAEGIRARIAEAMPALIEEWRPLAVGVGFGGPVDWRTGRIVLSHHVQGWSGFALGDWLAERCGLPIFVENDANAAALAEASFGVGRGSNPVFYVTVGSGVGGGLVCDGRVFHGCTPGESEIGHLRLDASGRTPEDYCSGWSLDRRIREAVAHAPQCALARRVAAAPGHEARHLGPAIADGDALAARILDEAAQNLALALSHVTHLFHPEAIVLGGGVSLLGEPWRHGVARHLRGFVMDAFQPGPRVALAALGEDAVPAGALALAAQLTQSTP